MQEDINRLSKTPDTALKFIWYFLSKNKIYFVIFCFLTLISAALHPVDSYVTKYFIDYLSTHNLDKKGMLTCSVLAYLWWEVFNIFFRVLDYVSLKIYPKIRTDVMHQLNQYILDHSHKYYQDNFAGAIANKISDLSKATTSVIETIFLNIIENILMFIISIIFLCTISFKLGMVVVIYLFAFIGVNLIFIRPIERYAKVFAENRAITKGKLIDLVTNIASIRYFANKNYEVKYFNKYLNETKQSDVNLRKYQLKTNYLKGLVNNIVIATIVYLTIDLYYQTKLSAGDFFLIFSLIISISSKAWDFLRDISNLTEDIGTIKQGLTLVTTPHEIIDKDNMQQLVINKAVIEFKNINFKYIKKQPLFNNLSVEIAGGSKIGLVGFSGSGKSSFVNLLIRLFDIEDGEILIDGQNIAEVTQESLRKNIAFIPQDPMLFHRSLMDNIRYGRTDATDQEVIDAAKAAHAHEFIMNIGYDALVGERGIKLSGGQRQRIAIARAILKNAPILILDEATSSLDSITEKQIQDSLEQLMSNRTTLVVAHRLSTLLTMDRILVFENGQIIEDGSHNELIKRGGLYAKLWNSQINGFITDKDLVN